MEAATLLIFLCNNSTESLHTSKRLASDITDEQEPQIIPKTANKTCWVWVYFVEKTDGRVLLIYIINI
ncbi:unnamed protein product [Rhizophagus irregularis]|nr:unnamed protein product [Rhizophagus irregularis]